MVVDRLGVLGCDVVGPSPEVIRGLAGQDIEVSDAPLTDIPMGRSEGGRYSAILSALLASDHTDAVVSVIGSSAQNPAIIVDRVLNAQPRNAKPLGVFLAPRADDALVQLQQNGVASFRTPESCADAVNAYLDWKAPGMRPDDATSVAEASRIARTFAGTKLTEGEAGALFHALGVAIVAHRVLTDASTSIDLPGPFAVKLLSPDVLHKTDAGMVKLDVTRETLRVTVERMLAEARKRYPGARIDGVLVQTMERGLMEAIVGYRRDSEIGPLVLVGVGGITAEVRKSTAVRVAPVTLATAHEMIEEIAEFALLRGFRNLPRGDCDALAAAVQAMSRLACLEGRVVLEAEINPLIVKQQGDGAVAVDGLVVFQS
jgi:acyl-CoA synthetase (NDP forming)